MNRTAHAYRVPLSFGSARKLGPAVARGNASPTLHSAAESIDRVRPTIQDAVYMALSLAGPLGLTRIELATRTGISENTVRPRVRELLKAGLIVEAGTRPSPSGRQAGILYLADR